MNGPSFRSVLTDRRVWLFVAIAVASAIAGWIAIPNGMALILVTRAGYWCVLFAFVLFVRALWRTYRGDLTNLTSAGWRRFDWISLGVVLLGGIVLIVHESFGFKIVMDELMLEGTSMSMHFTRTVPTPIRGGNVQGAFVIFEGMMDKRQLFFPFLESLLHDLSGYRPENAFVLNGILTFFVFLGLVNAAGRMIAGRWAGWLERRAFLSRPAAPWRKTRPAAALELLNIVMVLATMLIGARFIGRRDGASFTAFCYSGPPHVPGALCETAIFLFPVIAIILWVWWREEKGGHDLARAGGSGAHDPLHPAHPDLRHPRLLVAAAEQARIDQAVCLVLCARKPAERPRVFLRQADGPAQLLRAFGPGLGGGIFSYSPGGEAVEGAGRTAADLGGNRVLHPRLRPAVRPDDVLFLGPVHRSGDPPPEPADPPLAGDRGHDGADRVPARSPRWSRRSSPSRSWGSWPRASLRWPPPPTSRNTSPAWKPPGGASSSPSIPRRTTS